ncbi:hypothetical protein AC628_18075 [Bradyrhizobium sp. NAS96.2]|nr:hypothetical protein AC628_18075 [Bradyrhizobium sp. NAS96.2]
MQPSQTNMTLTLLSAPGILLQLVSVIGVALLGRGHSLYRRTAAPDRAVRMNQADPHGCTMIGLRRRGSNAIQFLTLLLEVNGGELIQPQFPLAQADAVDIEA